MNFFKVEGAKVLWSSNLSVSEEALDCARCVLRMVSNHLFPKIHVSKGQKSL